MKIIIKRVVFAILILAWITLIFYLSSQNAGQSSELSGELINNILNLFNKELSQFEIAVIDFMQFIIRKSAHMFLYVVLAILVSLEFSTYKLNNRIQTIFSVIICVCYAISDEIHQFFVPGRSCEIRDMLIDSVGVVIGIFLIWCVKIIKNKFSKKCIDI